MFDLLALGCVLAAPPGATPPPTAAGATPSPEPSASSIRRTLTRDVATSARFLDHGVIQVGVAGGYPHLYRLEAGIGILDYVTASITAHWLPGEALPRWSPQGGIAFWRGRKLDVGATYRQVLHPLPSRAAVTDDDLTTPDFIERSHYVLGALGLYQAWWGVGIDMGVVHTLLPPVDPSARAGAHRRRVLMAGGVHLRFGTRRWGVIVQGQMPDRTLEALFEVRFDAFELRAPGGWRLMR